MKKAVLLFLLLVSTLSLRAQGSWEVEADLSFSPRRQAFIMSEVTFFRQGFHFVESSDVYKTVALPVFSVVGGYKFDNDPVGLYLGLYTDYAYSNLYGGPSPLYQRELILDVLPQIRLYYLTRPNLRLYASLGAGLCIRSYSEVYEGDRIKGGAIGFSYLISPLGFSYGEHFYFNLHLSYAPFCTILQLGGGYRF